MEEDQYGNATATRWTALSGRAKRALEGGDFATAERLNRRLLNQVPSNDPKVPWLKSYLSEALNKLNRHSECDSLDQELLVAGKANHEGLHDVMNDVLCRRLSRGHEYYNRKDYRTAFGILNDALGCSRLILGHEHVVTRRIVQSWAVAEGEKRKQTEKEPQGQQRTGLQKAQDQKWHQEQALRDRLIEEEGRQVERKARTFTTLPNNDQQFNLTLNTPPGETTQMSIKPSTGTRLQHTSSAPETPSRATEARTQVSQAALKPPTAEPRGLGRSKSVDRGKAEVLPSRTTREPLAKATQTALTPPTAESKGPGRSKSVDRGRAEVHPIGTKPGLLMHSGEEERHRRKSAHERGPVSASSGAEVVSYKYFDLRSEPATDDQIARTKRWFDVYLAQTQRLLNNFRKNRNNNRVRIAVLDTGFNKANPDPRLKEITSDRKGQRRIIDYQSWVTDLPGYEDTHGHGTHCAMTLNRVAPEAALYIARICNNADKIDERSVANAIEHAVKHWKVDIISMSFGFGRLCYSNLFTEAVKAASEAGVLMFAAASNEGKNRGRTYPARDRNVFCVYSTNSDGVFSGFNPYFSPERNYGILGEHVLAPWSGEGAKRASGTSVATPIMAGVAALLLEFVRQPAVESQPKIRRVELLRTMHGMNKVLFEMKDDDEEVARAVLAEKYLYVTPWEFLALKRNEDEEEARTRIAHKINAILDQMD